MAFCLTKITWKKIFALLVAFIGFTQSFAIFAVGIASILSNAFLYGIGPDDRICLMYGSCHIQNVLIGVEY